MEKAMECRTDDALTFCCTAPEVLLCEPGGILRCSCIRPAAPVMACEVRIQYPENDPAHPTLMPTASWCDSSGIELALAVILAKSLGATK
jgi:hypothetical protein